MKLRNRISRWAKPADDGESASTIALAIGAVLAVLLAVAWWAPVQEARGLALLTLVPAAALGLGGAAFAVSQMRHRDEIVIERGPERR